MNIKTSTPQTRAKPWHQRLWHQRLWHQRLWRRLAAGLAPSLLATAALAAAPADRITLLVPDNADLNAWQVKVWVDSAAEEGVRLDVITDSALLAMGSGAAGRIAGLVVPDSAHIRASAAVVAAVKQYAYLGGKLMLVYDAGVQNENGFFPTTGNSRFADMVGVDYVFWNNGAGAATMVGFGPVVGTQARLDALSFPPGKYLPYTPPATLATTTSAATAFVPTSAADPSGMARMADTVMKRDKGIEDGSGNVRARRAYSIRKLLGLGTEASAALRYGVRNLAASKARDQHVFDLLTRSGDEASSATPSMHAQNAACSVRSIPCVYSSSS